MRWQQAHLQGGRYMGLFARPDVLHVRADAQRGLVSHSAANSQLTCSWTSRCSAGHRAKVSTGPAWQRLGCSQ